MRRVALLFLLLCLASRVPADEMPAPLRELEQAAAPGEIRKSASEYTNVRLNALRMAAKTAAVQAAVKWRYAQILANIESTYGDLDRIFDFRPLLLNDGKVVPPVIVEAESGYKLLSDTSAASVETTYQVIQDARLTTVPPSWRAYLLQSFDAHKSIHPGMLPKDDDEREAWRQAVREGWAIGVTQAEDLFRIGLSRLERDYRGMLRFSILAAQNIVRAPILAEGRIGIQVGERVLDVDQRIFRITQQARFNKPEQWAPISSFGSNTNP